MRLSASLREGATYRQIWMNVPTLSHPLLPTTYVDSLWARPYVFRDISLYPLSVPTDVSNDFQNLVRHVNNVSAPREIDRYKSGLVKIVDEHIERFGRLLFCDLLLYVDCLAYLCYSSDLMTESEILQEYSIWAKYIVDLRKSNIQCSSIWGASEFVGSFNENDLNSCLE